MTGLQDQLRALLSDRNTPETRAFFEKLLGYIDRRARTLWRTRYPDLLQESQVEEVVGEVLKRLVTGALASFRGESLGELMAFVRTVTDRAVWRCAQRVIRERDLLEGPALEEAESWFSHSGPDLESFEHVPEVPLNDQDQGFLVALLEAESKVEYSRRHGVSRAAVTQRVQRIRKRISAMPQDDQSAVDAWLHIQARRHLAQS
ncbi:MAG: hypothetical protein VX899_17125 [Myxococcota bacterium]|nr:hypothetical protein [Myxococcota bacterium]